MTLNQFPPQYQEIVRLLSPLEPYLVGGAVRDLLLGRPIHDLDFALPAGTIKAGRLLADNFQAGFFVLDESRETTRVILGGSGEPRLVVDLTLFQGRTIEEDLAARDFTITSMALEAGSEGSPIDPFHGKKDLQDRVIRPTSDRALSDDALRCLRAVRLAAQLEFSILPETKDQIQKFHPGLAEVSPERIRDELFRILAGPGQAAAFLSAQALGIYRYLLPGIVSDLTGRHIRQLETLWSLFTEDHDQDQAGNWFKGTLVHRLGRYRENIRSYLADESVPGRTVYQLTMLLPLMMAQFLEKPQDPVRDLLGGLPLANQEWDFLEKALHGASEFLDLSEGGRPLLPLDVYRFFRGSGEAGVGAIFLGLAGESGQQGKSQESWTNRLDAARTLLEGLWEHGQEWVDPIPVLDGNEIIEHLNLQPGPLIGELLESLREEQVGSGLDSAERGLTFLQDKLADQDGIDQ